MGNKQLSKHNTSTTQAHILRSMSLASGSVRRLSSALRAMPNEMGASPDLSVFCAQLGTSAGSKHDEPSYSS